MYFNFLFAMDGGAYVNGIERFRLLVAAASIPSSSSCSFLWLPCLINPQRRLMLRDFMDRQQHRRRPRAHVNLKKGIGEFPEAHK